MIFEHEITEGVAPAMPQRVLMPDGSWRHTWKRDPEVPGVGVWYGQVYYDYDTTRTIAGKDKTIRTRVVVATLKANSLELITRRTALVTEALNNDEGEDAS